MKKALADAIAARGYTTLTPVQEAVSDPELIASDMLVSAQTGSGKTLGFGLAIAPTLLEEAEDFERASAPLALVIAPTRELALQVKRELAWLYAQAGAVVASTVGGMDMRDERRALDRGAHIVVATPGRLRDHIMRGSIALASLRAIVLDEADEMLDLGFREDLEFILGEAPAERQTLMFSATVPASIARLAKSYQKDAVRISTTTGENQHADIEYRAMSVAPRDVENAIINVLRFYEAPNAIVFCNTRAVVNRMTTRLSNRGFSVVALSGELSQSERTHALQAMRDGRARVCVATDVAARGIDLPNLDLVIHADLPTNHETLLHRSGRTGRAGRKGLSALMVPPAARKKAERLLGAARLRAEWGLAPSAEAVTERDEERMLADPSWLEPVAETEQETVTKLTGQFTAEQLAVAYLRLYRAGHSAPEELSDQREATPKPRGPFGPSTWFSLAGGRAAGAEPRRLLPMLCKMGNLTREDIGAIRIQSEASYIELRSESVPGLVAALGPELTVEDKARLVQLDAPPDFVAGAAPAQPPAKKPYAKPKPAQEDSAPPPAKKPYPKPKPPQDDSAPPPAKKPYPKPKPPRDDSAPVPERVSREGGAVQGWTPKKARRVAPDGDGAKGQKPPIGKPSSKKNRARKAAAAAARAEGKGASGPKGTGAKPPMRKPRRPKT